MNSTIQVVELTGVLDSTRISQLRDEIEKIVSTGVTNVLLDFSEVKFMDSSGLGALVLVLKLVQKADRELYLCSLNGQVRMLFELTGMDKIFKIFASQDEFERQVLNQN